VRAALSFSRRTRHCRNLHTSGVPYIPAHPLRVDPILPKLPVQDHTLPPQITPCRRRRQPWPAAPSATPSKPYSKPHYKPYYKPYYQPYDNPALLVTRPSRAQGLHENWVVGATRTCGVALITALSA